MSIEAAVEAFLDEHGLIPGHFLLALSGGADSTALALVMASLRSRGIQLSAAHLNHHLRGEESDADQEYVAALASQLDLPLHVADGSVEPGRVRAEGLEAAARRLRYEVLEEIRLRAGADWIVTAHQKDDQAETLLLRLLTGSSPRRLAGIAAISREKKLLRPLLSISRAEIEAWLAAAQITARTDSSNLDPRFLRNRVRHELLPLLRQWNPSITTTLAETARQIGEYLHAVDEVVHMEGERRVVRSSSASTIEVPGDGWMTRELLIREIRRLDPASREVSAIDLRRLSRGQERQVSVTGSLDLLRAGKVWTLRRKIPRPAFEKEVRPGEPARIEEIASVLTLREAPAAEAEAFHLPAEGKLLCRNRRVGDRFRPEGSGSEKKLKDVLIDRKIPREERDALPLLTWNDRIVWVGGIGVSQDFRPLGGEDRCWRVEIEHE
jgi:tRNA(Ile)-lysidine synthase